VGDAVARPRVGIAVLFVLFCQVGNVQAQSDSEDPGASATEDDPAIAHYLEGERLYAAGRYELAIQEFEEALELSGKPELHFNIANCHERAGDYEAAAQSLEKFLASGRSSTPDVLRERIWRARARGAEKEAAIDKLVAGRVAEEVVQKASETASSADRPATPADQDPAAAGAVSAGASTGSDHGNRTFAYVALGVGGTAVVTALVFAGLSHAAGGDADADCVQQICRPEAKKSLDRERRYALAADISGIVGLAGLGLGGYLWYRSGSEGSVNAAPMATRDGVGLSVGARF